MIAKIKIDDIKQINIFVNSGKLSLEKIKEVTKADYVLNGSLYDMKGFENNIPISEYTNGTLVVGHKEIAYQQGTYGFRFDNKEEDATVAFAYYDNRYHSGKCENYMTTKPVLVRDGVKTYDTGNLDNSNRGRSAIGLTENSELVLLCEPDVLSTEDFTFDELADEMIRAGCVTAGALDGGGSSQGDFLGMKVTSTRIVANYILIYLKDEVKKDGGNEVKKVAIDIGHIKSTPNGVDEYDYNEYDYMKKIAEAMIVEFKKYPEIDARIIDYGEWTSDSNELNQVIRDVNGFEADVCISLHSDAFDNETVNGYTNYCYSFGGAGYTLANYVRAATLDMFPDMSDRGTKVESVAYGIIKYTNMPTVLVEQGYHTNLKDVTRLKEKYDLFALANVRGILKYFGINEMAEDTESTENTENTEAEEAIAWAKINGISDCTRLDEAPTRQELIVMLKRFNDKF